MNISKAKKVKWSEEEINILKNIWPSARTVDEIRNAFPERTQASLWLKAASLKLKPFQRSRKGTLEPLLSNTPESWYWLGFFLADGYISKDGEFSITLNGKDEDHLSRLGAILNCEIKRPYKNKDHVRIHVMDFVIAQQIRTILGLSMLAKTYNPPDTAILAHLSEPNLMYLFSGFFDGDGCLRKKGFGTITCHGSWLTVFKLFESKNLLKNVRLDKNGRVCGTVPKTVISILDNLPVPRMKRKIFNITGDFNVNGPSNKSIQS